MTTVPTLTGPAVILRAPRREDVAERLAPGRSPEIVHMFGGDPAGIRPLTVEEARAWVDRLIDHPRAWAVEHDGRLLGEVRLDSIDMRDRRARLATGLLDPAKLGYGLGRQAIRLVLDHAFGVIGLHRVDLRVVAYNVRAICCYRACGFVEEGRERGRGLHCRRMA